MQNTIIYLIGFFGIGKYSIAKELAKVANLKIVDSHYIINPVYSIVADENHELPSMNLIWDEAMLVRKAVLKAMEKAPLTRNFVLTDDLIEDSGSHHDFQSVQQMAQQRNATFVPVVLFCELEEYLHRVSDAQRLERMKSTDALQAAAYHKSSQLFASKHPNELVLDVTLLKPEAAARVILQHTKLLH
jgi:hypothetical protein